MKVAYNCLLYISILFICYGLLNCNNNKADKAEIDKLKSTSRLVLSNFPTEVEIDTSTLISDATRVKIGQIKKEFEKISTISDNLSTDELTKRLDNLNAEVGSLEDFTNVLALKKPKNTGGKTREDCVKDAGNRYSACKAGCGSNKDCSSQCQIGAYGDVIGCSIYSPGTVKGAYDF